MARFTDLSDEELQQKAQELGVEDASTLTREQLEAAILEKEPEATDESVSEEVGNEEVIVDTSMADRGHFVTPVADQGEQPAGADEELRPLDGTGELEPAEDEVADQTSGGGTGGATVTTTGNTGG